MEIMFDLEIVLYSQNVIPVIVFCLFQHGGEFLKVLKGHFLIFSLLCHSFQMETKTPI